MGIIMKKTFSIFMSVIIAITGVVMIISGINTIKNKDLYDSTVKATVVDIQEEYENDGEDSHLVRTAYVDYEINGVKYEHIESPEQSDDLKIGDSVEFLYQSKDPSQIAAKDMTKGAVIFIIVGVIAIIAGLITAIRFLIKR